MVRKIEDLQCWQCGRSLDDLPQPFGRRDACPGCGSDLHVCRLCASYDPGVAQACREPLEDTPADKTRSNYCEWFQPRPGAHPGSDPARARARDQLEDLFGMDSGSSARTPADARKGLADLFGDDD